jgi:hypothetical protein
MHLGQSLLQALFTHLSEAYTHTSATLLMKDNVQAKAKGHSKQITQYSSTKIHWVQWETNNNSATEFGQWMTSPYLPVKENVHCIFNNCYFSVLKQTR